MTSQGEASFVDARLCASNTRIDPQAQWISCWVMIVSTSLMDLTMGLTIEMNLLAAAEVDYFYW
jgi:hypothetical protein